MADHTYTSHLLWKGSTGEGYRSYPRAHRMVAPPASAEVALSADPHFLGDPDRLNPEQLLVMAASSCQLLAFLALAAQAGVDVLDYEDDAVGTMSGAGDPMSIETIVLSPVVRVAAGTDHEQVRRLIQEGHGGCYVANSLRTTVTVEPQVLDADPA